jgi:hypothetical protein
MVTVEAIGDILPEPKAEEAFALLGGDDVGVGALVRDNILVALQNIYSERESLSQTLRDTQSVVRSVGSMLQTVLFFAAVFVTLALFEVDTTQIWLLFSVR